jgi:hypothetical protein
LSSRTVAYSTPAFPLSPGVTTAPIGMVASRSSFDFQKASKSAGLGSAGRISVGATAAPSRTFPGPPVLRSPKSAVPAGGFTSTSTIAGSASDVSMRPRPFARSRVPVETTSPPFRFTV